MYYINTTTLSCVKCGKLIEVGFIIEDEDKVYCDKCGDEIIRAKRDCAKCAYFDWKIKVSPETANCKKLDLNPKWVSIRLVAWDSVAKKFYVIDSLSFISFPDAEQCVHYVDKEAYREKALKGEIETKVETRFVECKYCGTKYDLVKSSTCPRCGAPYI